MQYLYKKKVCIMAKYSEKQRQYAKKWDDKNLKRYSVAMPIALAKKMELYLEKTGMSKNGFIVSLVREKMEQLEQPEE